MALSLNLVLDPQGRQDDGLTMEDVKLIHMQKFSHIHLWKALMPLGVTFLHTI